VSRTAKGSITDKEHWQLPVGGEGGQNQYHVAHGTSKHQHNLRLYVTVSRRHESALTNTEMSLEEEHHDNNM